MNKACPKCYQSNPPEAAFCLNCATPLPKAQYGGGWQGNQPNYGGQQNFVNYGGDSSEASARAKWALALGVLGIVCLGLLASVPAIFVGWAELSAIKSGQSSPNGKGMATFGMWAGIVSTILQILVTGFLLLLGLMEAASSPYGY